jgi:hypothetical protein
MNVANLLQFDSLQKSKQLFRRETPKTPRFAEFFSATLGDFGEVRRIKLFLSGCACKVAARRWVKSDQQSQLNTPSRHEDTNFHFSWCLGAFVV